ncbi:MULTISPECIES: hypothetical protein [Carnobacterium]|uniref:hypothetical protein n=1 Tax=Carnobacterium TaxID=2747 RepID=UPI001072A385|nr:MULTISPECIES: hypothetical protein [Carnobacterium]MDT1940798.1 hypothetical protein [Carnobacterium divergens]MDT1943237.1 hypothetical protein [Carnobacterium divergens]MDT1949043.1 hypothetical protein [Carnobacterium divergens]MDT1951527.1 hypothetical protein [Carnobacterium divergens]MDT1956702.1 hypothetical protein [Carnobacterium divergens]
MASEYIYVHLDSVTNHVLSKGITVVDFQQTLKKIPNNILLLNTEKGIGEYETHTGFRIVRDRENVRRFLEEAGRSEIKYKWVDFENLELLRQLTPVEISELLYIAHAHTHLHSPFYYKLQNNYIYLTLSDGMNKVYYRYLDQFYNLLGKSIREALESKINEKRNFFQKSKVIEKLPLETIKEIVPYLKEGVLLSLKHVTVEGDCYCIPIYLLEDRLRAINTNSFSGKDLVGVVCYNQETGSWTVEEKLPLLSSI